ncbi:MAG: molybdate ABC transporter permease subunit [Devosia sp.]|nr:molybdate ABC transporter permease subunit [Devosia sp.]
MVLVSDLMPPILLTLALAGVTTLVLLVVGVPIAWGLTRWRWAGKEAVAAVVALPLVLPPTVLGFYLLLLLGPDGPGGALATLWGGRTLAFSFPGLVIGSVVYSLPFMVQPVRNAFEAVGERPLEVAATLRAGPWDRFLTVVLPLARTGIVSGVVLSFAHTVGEFGVVLMIGGNIPGKTKVLSLAMYDYVEGLNWGAAHIVAAGMVAFSFLVIAATMLLERRLRRVLS